MPTLREFLTASFDRVSRRAACTRLERRIAPSLAVLALCAAASAQTTLYVPRGDHDLDQFGFSVSGAGDVDGDGFSDFIVGTHDNSAGHHNFARVFSGQTGAPIYTFVEGAVFRGFGFAVAGAGDVDHDGFADVIVGAPLEPSGAAYVFSGKTGALLHALAGDVAGAEFGGTVAGAGDLNGDGYADLIVGAYYSNAAGAVSGRVRVFSGLDGSELYSFDGDAPGDLMGTSVAGAGDVDADGYADFIVGAMGCDVGGTDSGLARVYSGRDGSVLHEFHGEAPGDHFGHSVASAGDIDLDGYADLVVGAPHNATNGASSGAAYVFSGFDGSLIFAVHGHAAEIQFGWSVAGAGDVDGDGRRDVIVGANLDDSGADPSENSGSARVFSGLDGSEIRAFTGSPKDQLGYAVSGAGDVNRDGYADLVVGTLMGLPFEGQSTGRAEVYSGVACGPCFPIGTSYCFGHGGGTQCPCSNNSLPGSGQGCLHSNGMGAKLDATGTASIGADTLLLSATHLPNNVPGIYIQGNATQAGGLGNMSGDGLICVSGGLVRMGVSFASSSGASSFPQGSQMPISVVGHVMPGDVRHYQLWYRNPPVFCTSATYNFSNGLTIAWNP